MTLLNYVEVCGIMLSLIYQLSKAEIRCLWLLRARESFCFLNFHIRYKANSSKTKREMGEREK